ncbi:MULTISPECIES: hypothetical protein [Methylobacterium]|uniref:hypothetical protein n=1 Tax=Methylobacterium TaxID=407 RepID=UPI0013EDC42D|nr:hypothetical protein [Methylobacterium sp. DB0501]NGM33886.1 hypothetical protein [Methylobacterium sp. DB0501]
MADPIPSVAVATGSLVVTGSATNFIAAENDLFCARGQTVPIASRQSPTQITLKQPWPAASLSGEQAFNVLSLGEYWRSAISINKRFADLLSKWEVVSPFKFDAAGTLAERDGYNNQPRGFVYVATDQIPVRMYIKLANANSASDWSFPIYIGSGGQVEFQQALDQERTQRIQADAALGKRIDDITAGTDPNVRPDLNAEIARSTAKDSQHDSQIGSLRTDLTAEAGSRVAGDATLSQRIDTEAGLRANGDTQVGQRIDAETAARVAADTALGVRIDAEATTRDVFDQSVAPVLPLLASAKFLAPVEYGRSGYISASADTKKRIFYGLKKDYSFEFNVPVSVPGMRALRPSELARSKYAAALVVRNYRLVHGLTKGMEWEFGVPLIVPGARSLPPVEYRRSGYLSAKVDRNRRILQGVPSKPAPAIIVPADQRYVIYAAPDPGNGGRPSIFSEERATGRRLRLSTPGANEMFPSWTSDGMVTWVSDRTRGLTGGGADAIGGAYFSPPDRADEHSVLPLQAIVRWGDSLTEQANNWLALALRAIGCNFPVYNLGKSGRTTTGIAARQGALVFSYRPVGGTIPASGSVQLTPSVAGPCSAYANGAADQTGCRLAGVPGTMSWNGTTATFTRSAAGSAVAVPDAVPMVVDPITSDTGVLVPYHADCIAIIGGGTNDMSQHVAAFTNMRAICRNLKSRSRRFMVMPMFGSSNEIKGSSGYIAVAEYNAMLKAEFPDQYIQNNNQDLRQLLVSKNRSDEVSFTANDVIGPYLRQPNDPIHITRDLAGCGQDIIAQAMVTFMQNKGWI